MKARFRSFLTLLAKWEALKFAFAAGCVLGMLAMAVMLTLMQAGVDVAGEIL